MQSRYGDSVEEQDGSFFKVGPVVMRLCSVTRANRSFWRKWNREYMESGPQPNQRDPDLAGCQVRRAWWSDTWENLRTPMVGTKFGFFHTMAASRATPSSWARQVVVRAAREYFIHRTRLCMFSGTGDIANFALTTKWP